MKQKKCAMKRLNVPNFCYLKKCHVFLVKNGENWKKIWRLKKCTISTKTFLTNKYSLEHLNVLLSIFFIWHVFKNFDVHFWILLMEVKVRSWAEAVFRRIYFLKNFIWLVKNLSLFHPFYTYKDNYLRAKSLYFSLNSASKNALKWEIFLRSKILYYCEIICFICIWYLIEICIKH